jgi:hypothetical protein
MDALLAMDGPAKVPNPVLFAFAGSFFHVVTWRWPEIRRAEIPDLRRIPAALTNQLVVVRLDNNAKSPGIVLPKSH